MKKQSLIIIGVLALGVGTVLGYTTWSGAYGPHTLPRHSDTTNESAGIHRMTDDSMIGDPQSDNGTGMMNGMDHAQMMVKSEREFIEGMIPHHQEAIDTAKEVIERGGSTPEIKQLAENIVVAQEKEIAMMKEWYQRWYGEAYVTDTTTYEPMMNELSQLSGAALDKVFLTDMIIHHMGAVMMAQSVQPYIEHQEMSDLTNAIIETQTAEIELMRRLGINL